MNNLQRFNQFVLKYAPPIISVLAILWLILLGVCGIVGGIKLLTFLWGM